MLPVSACTATAACAVPFAHLVWSNATPHCSVVTPAVPMRRAAA